LIAEAHEGKGPCLAWIWRGLVAELSERGLKVDYRTVWSFVQNERLGLKKPW
jgi:putative transposase